jgi:hypothetical protein
MESDPKRPWLIDAAVLSLLGCPTCHGDLRLEATCLDEARLVCAGCGRGYPIVDGIPVLIAGRAEASDLH